MKKTLLFDCVLLPAVMLGPVCRAAAPGDADSSFGTGGKSLTSLSVDEDVANALAVQSDGKIVVAGNAGEDNFALLRLNANGTPDSNFGSGGKILHNFGSFESAIGVAIQSDGKIVVGGAGLIGGGNRDFAVARCLSGGGLDPAFNSGVVVTTDISGGFNDQVYAMALQANESILLGGSYRSNVAMVRYLPNGTLDPGFGAGGKVFTAGSTATEQRINALAVMSDGRIVAAGQSRTGSNTDVLVARYLSNGMPDTNFGTGGKTVSPIGAGNVSDAANAVAVLADGRVLIAGSTSGDFLVLRYTSGGVLDVNFGQNGNGGTTVSFPNGTENGTGIVVQPDGGVILTGTTTISTRDYFAAVRFTAGGVVDSTFGSGGGFAVTLTTGTDTANAALLQSDGKLLIAGAAGTAGSRDFGVARYETTAPLPLANWRQFYFGTTANTGNAANDQDPDKDGLVNLLEYAFGQNPTQGASRAVPSGQVSGGNFVSSFTAPGGVTGITYAAQWSPTMANGTWQDAADTGSGSGHTFSVSTAGRTRLYLRWKITAP